MIAVLDRDPTLAIDTSARATIGALYENRATGDVYRYVKNGGANTTVYGKLACRKAAATKGIVTMTQADVTSGTLGTITRTVGIWQAAIPTLNFGYVLIASDYTDVYTDDGVVDGDYLVCDGGATETFIADTAVAGEEHGVFGIALADDDNTTHLVKAQVFCW